MAGALNPTDKCLLHIPHKDFRMSGVDRLLTEETKPLLKALDDNFQSIERWVDRFYKECICDCNGEGGT